MRISISGVSSVMIGTALFVMPMITLADTVNVNFENPPYTLGSINGQDGWTSLGSVGSGCATYDHAVSSSFSTPGFGAQSLRISNAVTSGCFGDQTFAKPLVNAVGEASSTAGTFSVGTKQRHFEMQFDLASAVPSAVQPGLHMSVSPDRGDGSRMSYLRFEDNAAGIDVFFDDVQQPIPCTPSGCANFVETKIATLDRSVSHKIKLSLDTLDGPSNDIVKVWIDGTLVHTGTSWEDYYRFDPEASAEQSPRIVKTVLFRTSGDAALATLGKGFLIDNLSTLSGPILVGPPTDRSQCRDGGWKTFNNPTFSNQGECVSFVATHNERNQRDDGRGSRIDRPGRAVRHD